MPALLEPGPEQSEENLFAAAGTWPAEQPHIRHNRRHVTAARLVKVCLLLLAVGIAWRAWQLDQVPGVNGDEAWYGVQSQRFLEEYLYGKSLPEAERVNFRTPTGNIWNPFLMIPRVVLDATFAPSVWSLRFPALVSGLLTLLVNYWLCRRALDRTTAWLTTALLAVLPIAVIYSRLGWDACQSILFCLPLVYLPWLSRREDWSAARTAFYYGLALAAAMLVHPTNIFVVPLSAALFWPRISAAAKLEFSLGLRLMVAVAAFGAALGLGISRGAWAGVDVSNLMSAISQWTGDVVGLVNGATVYGSISLAAEELPGAQSWLWLLSLPTLGVLIAARILGKTGFLPQDTQNSAQRFTVLFDGTYLALLCFLGVAGPGAIQPGYERYGLWIVVPVTLLIVLSYSTLARRARVAVTILAIVQVLLLLTSFWQYYLRRFAVPAAEQQLAHWTYRADNDGSWAEMDRALCEHLETAALGWPRYILIDPADPQRWWFEWKWRYLSYGSGYQWSVQPLSPMLHGNDAAARWFMSSQTDSAKEKLSIRYLSN